MPKQCVPGPYLNKTLGMSLAFRVFIVSQDPLPPPPQSPVMVQYPHAAINKLIPLSSHREGLLGSVAVAVDSPRRGVVGQDAKVPVIGGVRVDSVDTIEGDFLHADLRGKNGRIMSMNPTTYQLTYYMQTPKGASVRWNPS